MGAGVPIVVQGMISYRNKDIHKKKEENKFKKELKKDKK